MIRVAHLIYLTGLALWVGGLASLALVAAPVIFRAAPSRAVAGAIFGPVLRSFGYVEMACAALMVVSSIVLWRSNPRGSWAEGARLALVAVMVLLVFSYTFGVNPAVAAERSRVPEFDRLPEGAPSRARFDRLHRWSVRLMGANLFVGLTLLMLSAATLKSVR